MCWADQKEAKEETQCLAAETVVLSPLTESDRFDVPPSSVLFPTRPNYPKEDTVSSKLDSTVVLQKVDLDTTFEMPAPSTENNEPNAEV